MERWREVAGFCGYYQVSDTGRVRTVGRVIPREQVDRLALRLWPDKAGHILVHLWRRGIRHSLRVDQLVLTAFAGPRPAGCECLHGAGGVSDNSVENLSWSKERA